MGKTFKIPEGLPTVSKEESIAAVKAFYDNAPVEKHKAISKVYGDLIHARLGKEGLAQIKI